MCVCCVYHNLFMIFCVDFLSQVATLSKGYIVSHVFFSFFFFLFLSFLPFCFLFSLSVDPTRLKLVCVSCFVCVCCLCFPFINFIYFFSADFLLSNGNPINSSVVCVFSFFYLILS